MGRVGRGERRGRERGARSDFKDCSVKAQPVVQMKALWSARHTIAEAATQTNGGVPSSLLTKVKALGSLWLGLCNALCARPLWVVWGRGKGEGERGARPDFKDCSVRAQPVVQMKALWSARHIIAEDATQKSGGVPSSLLTQVKTLGFLWLGLCNALCARPFGAVWG